MKTVKHARDTLPPLTEAQKDNLKRLAVMPHDEVDTSDIPELTDAQIAEMKRHRHYCPVKEQIKTRLDSDLLAWLNAGGKGCRSRMNAIP